MKLIPSINIQKKMGLFGAAKADPKKQVNEMSQLLRPVVDRHYPDGT